ncbi:MAG: VanW family protein [Ruminococcus sp.]|nr:VanW family protein [Ruminococcus sp.]
MDNFYSDKYNLDFYSDSNPRERNTDSPDRSSRPQRDDRFSKEARAKRAARAKKPAPQPKAVRKREDKAPKKQAVSQSSPAPRKQPKQKPPRKPKPAKKNIYRAQRKKKTKGQKILTAVITVLVVGIIAGTVCVVGYNLYRENKKRQPFKFSENVNISGINIGGLSMDEAKAKLKKNSLKAVNDIDLTISANDKKSSYTKSDFTYTFNYDAPLREAKLYSLKEQGIYDPPKGSTEPKDEGELKMPKLRLEYTFDKKSAAKLAKAIAKKVDCEPKNAKVKKFHPFSDERFEYKEGDYGYSLDKEDLALKITRFMRSGNNKKTIEASVEQLTPSITVADLQEKITGLSTATSTSFNTENGNTNMRVALKACNGSIIEPGETWSFNECTGDSNDPKNGYKKATVITDRKLEEGYGGGICQASTTIFQAGAFANMGIYERHNHYWASGYAYSGEDATIDYPNLDVKLTNPTQYQMFIECRMDGNVLICNIYGVQEDYYDNIKIYTKNYDIKKKKGYSTHTYRVLYLDGKIVSDDIICESDYSLTDKHVVQEEDKGTFRTKVDGTQQTETDPPKTEPNTSGTEETSSSEDANETITEPDE